MGSRSIVAHAVCSSSSSSSSSSTYAPLRKLSSQQQKDFLSPEGPPRVVSASRSLMEFYSMPRHERVSFHQGATSGSSYFTLDGKRVPGIHALINATLTKNPNDGVYAKRPRLTKEASARLRTASERKHSCTDLKPKAHGKIVDDQFSLFVDCVAAGSATSFEACLAKTRYPSLDPCARELILHVQEKLGWKPSASQVHIASDELMMATGIDFIATDKADKERYLCELKVTTSFSDEQYRDYKEFIAVTNEYDIVYVGRDTRTEDMQKYPVCVPNSQFVLDQLQLLIMKRVVETEYNTRFDGYYLIRVHLTNVKLYSHQGALDETLEVLLEAIKKTRGLASTRRGVFYDKNKRKR